MLRIKDFQFESSFSNEDNTQGYTGIIVNTQTQRKVVYKISQYMDHLIKNEYKVGKVLNKIQVHYYFTNTLELVKQKYVLKQNNPFDVKDRTDFINDDVLLLDHISSTTSLYKHIFETEDLDTVFQLIKHILLAVYVAQTTVKFTHYDLHSNNVLVKTCDPNIVYLYTVSKDNHICLPTCGYMPIIIDFGYSFVKQKKFQMRGTLSSTDKGYTLYEHDRVFDLQVLLNSTLSDIREAWKKSETPDISTFRRLVRKLFKPVAYQKDSGWSTFYKYDSITDEISDKLLCDEKIDEITYKTVCIDNINECIELFHSSIHIPIQSTYQNLKRSFETSFYLFLTEFVNVERLVRPLSKNKSYPLYILKQMVSIVSKIPDDYEKKEKKKQEHYFQTQMCSVLKMKRKVIAKELNTSKLLKNIKLCMKHVHNEVYFYTRYQKKEKEDVYKSIPFDNAFQVLGLLEYHIPSMYTFNTDTKIKHIDIAKKSEYEYSLTDIDTIINLNQTTGLQWGSILYNFISKK